ncbi:arginine repressor [Sphingomonas sp.]|uniref:arginine repressor n=1 Tax=Sphingomonas sp. TaxID=28214 RepID=UPI0025CE365D|nr:arginine repressor [Sphingomonas sp.]MBV9528196.1 arginine repressor [Sphingomonas sp.]
MSRSTDHRRSAIADLIRQHRPASQEEVAEQLAGLGFAVTQATVSRDLEQLGAVKVRHDGRLSYALPDTDRPGGRSRVATVLRDWARSVAVAGNLVVIRTPPGSAHLVGVALDEAELAGIVGTICGDDTIFAATPGSREAEGIAAQLDAMRSGQA